MRLVRRATAAMSIALLLQTQLQALGSSCASNEAPAHQMASMTDYSDMAMPMASQSDQAPTPSNVPVDDCRQEPSHRPCDGPSLPNGCDSMGACTLTAIEPATLSLTVSSNAQPARTVAPLALRSGITPPPESPPPRA